MNFIDEIEENCEINLNWFYHSTYYEKNKYTSILTEGIKCRKLLNQPGAGRYNGKYYISLSKITIPDNKTFLFYTFDKPSFIIDNIDPIKCKNTTDYEKYIYTKDPRRMGNYYGEYQYYYLIKPEYIKGIVYNLFEYTTGLIHKTKLKDFLDLINLLETLNINIPIYDYSRRNETLAHKIDKEKVKYYKKDILN